MGGDLGRPIHPPFLRRSQDRTLLPTISQLIPACSSVYPQSRREIPCGGESRRDGATQFLELRLQPTDGRENRATLMKRGLELRWKAGAESCLSDKRGSFNTACYETTGPQICHLERMLRRMGGIWTVSINWYYDYPPYQRTQFIPLPQPRMFQPLMMLRAL